MDAKKIRTLKVQKKKNFSTKGLNSNAVCTIPNNLIASSRFFRKHDNAVICHHHLCESVYSLKLLILQIREILFSLLAFANKAKSLPYVLTDANLTNKFSKQAKSNKFKHLS